MATLQPFPKFRAFDADGNPLSGGLVYTYAAGTSTPLVTYTDSSGSPSSENTNPVQLDADGEADIWYGENLYKLALYNSTGVLQWTVDNVGSGSDSNTNTGGFGTATDIASASLVDLGTISSHFANITGTTTITSFGSSALITAPIYLIKFEGALTLTNSANLFLPNSINITTSQNDRAFVEYLGSGAWRVFNYMQANPELILPVVSGGTGADNAADARLNLGIKPPTRQYLTSGTSATYTTPAGATKLFVYEIGAGGGAGGVSGSGGTGGTTSFNSITAVGGTGGASTVAGNGGIGGTGGSGSASLRLAGAQGGAYYTSASFQLIGTGGVSPFGGAGAAPNIGSASAGGAAKANTGSGGAGACPGANVAGGAGGGAGEYVEFSITSPAATYTYTVGAAGTAGSGAQAGGAGGSGLIIVEEYYE